MRICRLFVSLLAWVCLTTCFATEGWAQRYPTKVIRYVTGFSAGSGTDVLARIVAEGMTPTLGQRVIVENRPGAAGNIGAAVVAKALPDGYTLFHVSATHAANAGLYLNLQYDLLRDFVPVTQIATSPTLVVVNPSLPVKSISELVKLAKARPGAIDYSSGGAGSAPFLGMEMFKRRAGVDIRHVPYRSGVEGLIAVVTGEVSVYFAAFAVGLPQVQQGRLRPIAVTTTKRLPVMANVPTIDESGYRGFEAGNWYGMLAPTGTPREVIVTLRNAVIAALNDPVLSKRLGDLGYILVGDQPEEFGSFMKAQVAVMKENIKQSGLTAE